MCNIKFKPDELKKIGYSNEMALRSGDVTGKALTVSWRGNTDLDWKTLTDLVYESTTAPLYSIVDSKLINDYIDITNFTKLNFTKEQCTLIEDISSIIWFYSLGHQGIKILVSDSNLQLTHRQNNIGISGDIIRAHSEYNSFSISTTIIKKRPEKNSCKAYNTDDGYKQCVETAVRQQMVDLLGCIPPWMTKLGNENICYHDVQFNDLEQAKQVRSKLQLLMQRIAYSGFNDFGCKLPCTQLHLDVQQLKRVFKGNHWVWVEIQFEDSVKVYEEENNYTFFDLMVEVGSSLGLWIGLSAIGIFDLVTDVAVTLYRVISRNMRIKEITEKKSDLV